jgi:hypothetical protein
MSASSAKPEATHSSALQASRAPKPPAARAARRSRQQQPEPLTITIAGPHWRVTVAGAQVTVEVRP